MERIILQIVDGETVRRREQHAVNRFAIERQLSRVTVKSGRLGHLRFEPAKHVLNFSHHEVISLKNRVELVVRGLSFTALAVAGTVQISEQQEAVNHPSLTSIRQGAEVAVGQLGKLFQIIPAVNHAGIDEGGWSKDRRGKRISPRLAFCQRARQAGERCNFSRALDKIPCVGFHLCDSGMMVGRLRPNAGFRIPAEFWTFCVCA